MWQANQDVPFLINRLCEEARELCDPPKEGFSSEKHVEQEVADIILFGMAILRVMNLSLDQVIAEKVARNTVKYPPYLFVPGIPFEEGIRISREEWTKLGGDQEFYATSSEIPKSCQIQEQQSSSRTDSEAVTTQEESLPQ